jgi:hypothetical protein
MDMHSGLIARNVSDEEKQFYNIDTQSVENGVTSATSAVSTTAVTTTAVSTAAVTASATTTSIATTAVEVKQVELIGQVSML